MESLAKNLPRFKDDPNVTHALIQLAVENLASEHLLSNTPISYNPAFGNLLLLYDASKNNPRRLCNEDIFIDPHISTFTTTALEVNHFINDKARYAIQFLAPSFETHCSGKTRIKPTDSPKYASILTMSDILNAFIKDFCQSADPN